MSPVVEIVTPTDTVAFHPTPDITQWVYDNETLDRWYAQASTELSANKRPNGHGIYSPGRVYVKEHNPILSGQYYGYDEVDALEARDRLAGLFNEGESVVMRVTDARMSTTREVWLLDREAPFRFDGTHFTFDLVFVAPDPRRYEPEESDVNGMPSPGSGLVWPLGTSVSGLFWDWGSAGVSGRVSFTNRGRIATNPILEVGGAGSFASGFRITEVETGRELTLNRPTNVDDIVVLNSRTQRATIGDGAADVTGAMSARDWYEIPAGATRQYQINALGAFAGAPTITVRASSAHL